MADPIRELLSQTSYDTDGTTTVWNFSFAGGYIERAHVKVQLMDKVTLNIVQVPITEANFIGDFQLQLIPAFPIGAELTIYRDSPKDVPLVNFTDKAALTESSLDLNARQAIFVAAESSDQLATSLQAVSQVTAQVEAAKNFAESAEASAAGASASAASAAASAVTTTADVAASAANAAEAAASASLAVSARDVATAAAAAASTSESNAEAYKDLAVASANSAASNATAAGDSVAEASLARDSATASKLAAAGSATAANASAVSAAADADEAQAILDQVILKAIGGYLFEQGEWNGPRLTIPSGFIPEDGQQVFGSVYPDAVAAIRSGKQHAISEAAWQADPLKRNCWSLGDGSTWVRAPDNNGIQSGSLGKLYKAGDGGSLGGTVVSDTIRNITGNLPGFVASGGAGTGAFVKSTTSSGVVSSGTNYGDVATSFDASRVVPTASENRPKTSYQCFIVRVATATSTNGATDLEALAAQVNGAISEIEPLKNRQKSLGDGQSRQNATRTLGVTYTNSSGRAILVGAQAAVLSSATSGYLQISVDGAARYTAWGVGGSSSFGVVGTILAGETFVFTSGPSGKLPTTVSFWEVS